MPAASTFLRLKEMCRRCRSAAAVNSPTVLLCALLAGAAVARADDLKPPEVLAHGSDERLWVGQISRPSGSSSFQTTIAYRLLGQEDKWHELTRSPIPARVVALGNRGEVLAALLDDGTWLLIYSDGSAVNGGAL